MPDILFGILMGSVPTNSTEDTIALLQATAHAKSIQLVEEKLQTLTIDQLLAVAKFIDQL